jgi:hypothetical protein
LDQSPRIIDDQNADRDQLREVSCKNKTDYINFNPFAPLIKWIKKQADCQQSGEQGGQPVNHEGKG